MPAEASTPALGRERAGGLTCVVADDHPAVLDSIARYLEAQGVDVVARVARTDEALDAIERLRPAIALLDVAMYPVSGIDVARDVAQRFPETRTVLYTGHHDRTLLSKALEAGASGFVLKEAPLAELLEALRLVAQDGTYIDPRLSRSSVPAGGPAGLAQLTPREQEVLSHLADGKTNDRVAETLRISPETVQSHVRNAMTKLDADTRTQAVATALRQALIS